MKLKTKRWRCTSNKLPIVVEIALLKDSVESNNGRMSGGMGWDGTGRDEEKMVIIYLVVFVVTTGMGA